MVPLLVGGKAWFPGRTPRKAGTPGSKPVRVLHLEHPQAAAIGLHRGRLLAGLPPAPLSHLESCARTLDPTALPGSRGRGRGVPTVRALCPRVSQRLTEGSGAPAVSPPRRCGRKIFAEASGEGADRELALWSLSYGRGGRTNTRGHHQGHLHRHDSNVGLPEWGCCASLPVVGGCHQHLGPLVC